jgi:hypothetical protein
MMAQRFRASSHRPSMLKTSATAIDPSVSSPPRTAKNEPQPCGTTTRASRQAHATRDAARPILPQSARLRSRAQNVGGVSVAGALPFCVIVSASISSRPHPPPPRLRQSPLRGSGIGLVSLPQHAPLTPSGRESHPANYPKAYHSSAFLNRYPRPPVLPRPGATAALFAAVSCFKRRHGC